jgi:hypothetical protein
MQSLTTRSPNGLTNAAPWQALGNFGAPDPTWAQLYANDFITYIAADWTITLVGTTPTNALTAADGGALLTTTSTGATDSSFLQLTTASFKLTSGKRTFFKFAGALSDATASTFIAGLQNIDSTPLDATDGIWFLKTAAQTGFVLKSVVGGVITSVALPAPCAAVNGVQFELGFEVDPQGNIFAFFNPSTGANPIASGQFRGPVASIMAPSLTTALLTPSFGLQNGAAAAKTLTTDYIVAVRER